MTTQSISAQWGQFRQLEPESFRWQRQALHLTKMGLAFLSPLWLYALFTSQSDYDPTLSLFLVPVIAAISLPIIFVVTRRESFLRQVMLIGFFAKLAATGAFLYMNYEFYDGAADSVHYFYEGILYAYDVRYTGHWTLLKPFWSVNAIYMLTGTLIVFLGPALQTINLLYALMAFTAEYFFYRAFCMVAPPGADSRGIAILLFLFPSIVFWTSGVGKDAPIALCISMAVYGFACMCRGSSPKGVLCVAAGLAGTLTFRPHIAAMLSISMVLPYALSRNRRGITGGFSKAVIAPALILASLYLTWRAQDFLEMKNYQQATAVIRKVGNDNSYGNSAFNANASVAARALAAPILFFRPFVWEVRNLQSLIASGEASLLLVLFWRRRKNLLALVRRWRDDAFTAFLLLFLVEFSLIYSAAITNFGLLARERVMALPFFLIALWLTPRDSLTTRREEHMAMLTSLNNTSSVRRLNY